MRANHGTRNRKISIWLFALRTDAEVPWSDQGLFLLNIVGASDGDVSRTVLVLSLIHI